MSKKPEMEPLIIISLMSGTSCDSIDVGLCQVFPDFSCKLLDGFNYKYPDEVKERIFNIFTSVLNRFKSFLLLLFLEFAYFVTLLFM